MVTSGNRSSRPITEAALRRLYATKTDDEIGAIYGITGRSVYDWRMKYGIPTMARKARYSLDVDFFETIDTEEKAYVLGFVSADGFVARSGKQLFVSLQARDEPILKAIRRAMGSNAPIRDRPSGGGFANSGPQRVLTISSRKIVSDLAAWGVVPGKTYTFRYPKIPNEMERHFARGSLDGDGHIRAIPKRLFEFKGTEAFVDGLAEAIFRHTGARLRKYAERGCWRLSGYGGSANVMRWIYNDATICLERKRRVFLDHWQ